MKNHVAVAVNRSVTVRNSTLLDVDEGSTTSITGVVVTASGDSHVREDRSATAGPLSNPLDGGIAELGSIGRVDGLGGGLAVGVVGNGAEMYC